MSGTRDEYCLLGFIPQATGLADSWSGTAIALRASDQHVAISEYPIPHAAGSVMDIASWMKRQPGRVVVRDGKNEFVREAPGWFERKCRDAGATWFLPIAHPIAEGEKVPWAEIEEAYAAAHLGRPIPRGALIDLFAYQAT